MKRIFITLVLIFVTMGTVPTSNAQVSERAMTPSVPIQASSLAGSISREILPGTNSEEVKMLQTALSRRGLYKASVDGKYGAGTKEAVRTFQSIYGIPKDGIANNPTLTKIGITPISSRVDTTTVRNSSSCTPVVSEYAPSGIRYWTDVALNPTSHPEIKRYKIQWFAGHWSDWYTPGENDVDWKDANKRVWRYFDDHNYQVETCGKSFNPHGNIGQNPGFPGSTPTPKPVPMSCSATSAPSIKLLAPNSGGTYQIGQPLTVTWETCNVPANNSIGILFQAMDGQPRNYVYATPQTGTGIQNDGTETFTIPNTHNLQGRYEVRVEGGGRWDGSDVPIHITSSSSSSCLPTSPKSLKIISPNGGQTYVPGQSLKIEWEDCNIDSNARIYIFLQNYYANQYLGGHNGANSAATLLPHPNYTNNDGSETVTLQEAWLMQANHYWFGKNFTVMIATDDSSGGFIRDESDNRFTINSQGSFRPGCSSYQGYSATTGVACNTSGSTDTSCLNGGNYSATTGLLCNP